MIVLIFVSIDVFISFEVFWKELVRQGNYFFRGNGKDFIVLIELMFNLLVKGEVLDYIGYNKCWDMWVFGNGVVKDGEFLEFDSLGMVDGFYLFWVFEENEYNLRFVNFCRIWYKELEFIIYDWYWVMAGCYGYEVVLVMVLFIIVNLCYDYIVKVKI